MNWNYRIIRYQDGSGYGLHEVFYENGNPDGYTEEPVRFGCHLDEGPQGIRDSLQRACLDANELPVLDERVFYRTANSKT